MNHLEIVGYKDTQLDDLIGVLFEVRDTYPVYPPPAYAGNTDESFRSWFFSDEAMLRKVALSDGKVVGHGMLSEPHDYIVNCLEQNGLAGQFGALVEIGKLFVTPTISHGGTGSALLNELTRLAVRAGRVPVSCILEDSPESLALHKKLGFKIVASFDGVSGVNHILIPSV